MSAVSCRGLCKAYASQRILEGVDLDLPEGGIVALLGSSGVGKSTLGRILCGLETADQGSISFSQPARIMFIPQDFVVWPHLTVDANVALGCRGPKAQRNGTVSAWLSRLGLSAAASRLAGELSYGQQQRVAVARAFCFQPDIMILDEPFAHFDTPSRTRAAKEIAGLCSEQRITTLWITHDAKEAFAVAEKIAILEGGLIPQFDVPEAVYRNPATEAVALLTGEMNLFQQAEWEEFLAFCDRAENLPNAEAARVLGLRPADIQIGPQTAADGCSFIGKTFVGHGYHYHLRLSSGQVINLFHPDALALDRTYKIRIKIKPCIFRRD